MRLLIVSQYFWPEDFRINELALALRDRGHDVTVLTSVPNYPEGAVHPDYSKDPSAFAFYHDIEILRVPQIMRGTSKFGLVANYLSFAAAASVLGAWRLRGRPFDAVFVFQTSPVTVGIPGGFIAWLKRAPMMMWILDCWPETLKAIGVGAGTVSQAVIGWLVRSIYASADLLLGQSKGFAANVARYGRAEKFRHFPNWVEAAYADMDVLPNDLVPPAPAGTFTVAYAGNIGEAQDFPAIVAAASLLRGRPVRFLVIGDGRDLARTQADVAAQGLDAMFHFAGRHPAALMPGFYAHADALLVALRPDPLFALTVPGKVQTYMSAGKPIVAMLDGEGATVIEEARCGLCVAASDSAGLADTIVQLTDMDDESRAKLGAAGRAYAHEKYDLQLQLDRLEEWFRNMISPGPGRLLR